MSRINIQFNNEFMTGTEDVVNVDSSEIERGYLEEFLEPFITNEDITNFTTHSSISFDNFAQDMADFSLKSSPSSNTDGSPVNLSNVIPQTTTMFSFDIESNIEHLKMIEQPYQSSKLRYRADYIREKGRLGVLSNKNEKSTIKGPVIRISEYYLNPNDQYFIRVALVTVKHMKTNLHYLHPYELEHPKNEQVNDRQNNAVWFPIEQKYCIDGLMNFPNLRIVKKKVFQVQILDNLAIFDCHDATTQNTSFVQLPSRRDIDFIQEYNLEKSQLAFTLGKRFIVDGQISMILYANTTIYSEEMDEFEEKQSDTDIETESLSSERLHLPSSNCFIYKYAPRSGTIDNNDEMLVFLRSKPESKKYGNLQVVFEYETSGGRWSPSIVDLDIKDRMISFKIPKFPYPIKKATLVDIILRQDDRILGVLKYSYLPIRK